MEAIKIIEMIENEFPDQVKLIHKLKEQYYRYKVIKNMDYGKIAKRFNHIKDVAEYLNCSKATVYNIINNEEKIRSPFSKYQRIHIMDTS